ncbi:MAG TPA: cytochrome c biogenesis protein ResB [Pyrinomonadaceae bacterium]|jgi:cytochrome c biogenesis protein
MSAIEETKREISVGAPTRTRARVSPLNWLLNLLSSVRFGVMMLVVLAAFSMIGMLVEQQNVEGFERNFANLTPATKLLFGTLGFFDIYHAWYFNLTLLILSLNIVLASIDRFPGAWQYVRRPKFDVQPVWLAKQPSSTTLKLKGESRSAVAQQIAAAAKRVGLKAVITEKGNRTFVFTQKGAWNRLGAYFVHVALLTIFTGGFLTTQFGRTGTMQLRPGTNANQMKEVAYQIVDDQLSPSQVVYPLPFTVECTDIQQKLIKQDGPITADNTIDWLTKINIKDETGTHEALVHLNRPFDYRGYRFFQASFTPLGQARTITLRVTPEQGGEPQDVTIPRDGATTLKDGTHVEFADFYPEFKVGGSKTDTEEGVYNNPAAELKVTPPGGTPTKAYAFNPTMAESAPFAKRPVAGYTWRLVDFEKVPAYHFLSIQHDPGSSVFYLGGAMLALALASVFFFSHQRIWAVVEEAQGADSYEVLLGGNTNRNLFALEDTFKKLTAAITGRPVEVDES